MECNIWDGKGSICNAGDLGSIPGLRISPGGGPGNRLQSSCLENPHGQRSLGGCSPWGHKELDTTEQRSTAHISWQLVLISYSSVNDPELCVNVQQTLIESNWRSFFSSFFFFNFWLCWIVLEAWGSLVAVHGLSCPLACETLIPSPGIEPVPLHWKVDS